MLYNVLVVDDDRRTAQGLAAMIGVLGHTVGIAYGPRMAIQQLNEVIPDVIFLDVNMPGVTGLEVLRYLRRDPYTANVPVVIVSANDSAEEKKQALEAGANHYIVKPPTMEEIESALARMLAGLTSDGSRITKPLSPATKTGLLPGESKPSDPGR